MTTFPKIRRQSTYLTVHPNGTSTYGPYPPKELSFYDVCTVPGRVNPLAPNPPKRRINMSWETTEQHWHNSKRSMWMKQREHTRYHTAWQKPFYGSAGEKELYRKHFREVLKQQMTDKGVQNKQQFIKGMKESEEALETDRHDVATDSNNFAEKFKYLTQYRNDNKSLMEHKWRSASVNKTSTDLFDRETLRFDPINWSKTLT